MQTGVGVRDGGARRQEGDAHDAVGNAEGETDQRHHPHHHIAEDGRPGDGGEEGDEEEVALLLAVGNGVEKDGVQRCLDGPLGRVGKTVDV